MLLDRWIVPLDCRIDDLNLRTGRKIQVPFLPPLIIATSLDPEQVTDPAFLRWMGDRLFLAPPSPGRYRDIVERYAGRHAIPVRPGCNRVSAPTPAGAARLAAGGRSSEVGRVAAGGGAGGRRACVGSYACR